MSDSLPAGWSSKRISEIARSNPESLGAGTPRTFRFRYIDLGNTSLGQVNWENLDEHEFSLAPSRARRAVRPDDVLFGTVRPSNQSHGYVEAGQGPLVASTGFTVLRADPDDGTHPRFLFHTILSRSITKQAENAIVGSNYPAVNESDVAAFEIAYPPLPEQRRIAEILDTVDEAIRKTEEVIAKLEQMKQGLLHDLLTRGIDENGELRDPERHPEQFKDSPLGRIPREWRTELLGGVADVSYGISDAIDQTLTDGVPTITLPCVAADGTLTLDDELLAYTAARKVPPSLRLRPGDLLFNWRNGSRHHLGKTAFFEDEREFTHVGFLLRIRAEPGSCVPLFLCEQVRFLKQDGYFLRAKSQVNNTFNSGELRQVPLVVPPLEEQRIIAETLREIAEQIAGGEAERDKLTTLKRGLMDDLLTGRVRVTVDDEAAG